MLTLLNFQGTTHLLGVGSFNNVIKVDSILNNVIQVKDVSLDANNKFGIQNGDYLWDSDNSCFYQYDERKGEYDKSQPYTKQYYTGD